MRFAFAAATAVAMVFETVDGVDTVSRMRFANMSFDGGNSLAGIEPGSLQDVAAVPMLRRWQVDVVAHGASAHDDDSYYLVRRYRDVAEREASQDAFYGSAEWREGPREAILALIDTYTSIVLELEAGIAALRQAAR